MSGANLVTLVRWEWFKLRRRWLPWILLLVAIAFAQILLWVNYVSYHSDSGRLDRPLSVGPVIQGPDGALATFQIRTSCRALLQPSRPAPPAGIPDAQLNAFNAALNQQIAICQGVAVADEARKVRLRQMFTLPFSVVQTLAQGQNVGLFLLVILTGSVLGAEYGWGTLRPVLVRGVGRGRLLGSKLALMVLLAGVLLASIALTTAAGSWLAATLAAGDGFVLPAARPPWSDVLRLFFMAWYAILPYIALAAFAAVLSSSSIGGIGFALGYNFLEQILLAVLMNTVEGFESVANYVLGWNISAWMDSGSEFGGSGGFLPRLGAAALGSAEAPEPMHAFLVILAYTAVLVGLAYWIFTRRDVAGAAGS